MKRSTPYSQAAISDLERGVGQISDETLRRLALILKKPLDYFIGDDVVSDEQVIERIGEAQANFRRWKAAVGLPDAFPKLSPLSEDELDLDRKYYASPDHRSTIEEILTRASSTFLVAVNRGQGCTTLSRLVFKILRSQALIRRKISVRLALDEVEPSELVQNAPAIVDNLIRRELLRSLAFDEWELVLGSAQYSELTGSDSDVEAHRMALRATLRGPKMPDVHKLERIAPTLTMRLNDLLVLLSDRYAIRVQFSVDLSSPLAYNRPAIHERATRAVLGALRGVRAMESLSSGSTNTTMIDEMFFGSPDTLKVVGSEVRANAIVQFPWYRPLDMFAMLAHHYPARPHFLGRHRTEVLAAVVDPDLLDDLCGPNVAILKVIEALERRLLGLMGDRDGVQYRLQRRYQRRAL